MFNASNVQKFHFEKFTDATKQGRWLVITSVKFSIEMESLETQKSGCVRQHRTFPATTLTQLP